MEVEFRNVTISIVGVESAQEAYDTLCGLLAIIEGDSKGEKSIEWTTDTFVIRKDNERESEEQSTELLFPPLA